MTLDELRRVEELCQELGIKTFAELQHFEDCHNLKNPTGKVLIQALEKELYK